MPYLIRPFATGDPLKPRAYRTQLQRAHDDIVQCALRVRQPGTAKIATWGAEMKRTATVHLVGAHPWVEAKKQPLTEVVNQCATVERLLDTLEWIASRSGLRNARILECNPTTSWRVGGHDLRVMFDKGEACFEVSDVASAQNNNEKLDKDLFSLQSSSAQRKFLVVSHEWYAKHPRPRNSSLAALSLSNVALIHYRTGIIEVVEKRVPRRR